MIHALELFHQIFVTVFLGFSLLILFVVIFLLRKVRLAVDVILQIGNLIKKIADLNAQFFFRNLELSEQKYEDVEKVLAEIPDTLAEIPDPNNEAYMTPSFLPKHPAVLEIPPPLPTRPAELEIIYETMNVIKFPTESTGAIPKRRPKQQIKDETEISTKIGKKLDYASKQQNEIEGIKGELEDEKVVAASKLSGMKEMVKTKGPFAFFGKKKKMDNMEMVTISSVGETKIEVPLAQIEDEMEDIDLTDEMEEPKNTKKQRFKNVFKKC